MTYRDIILAAIKERSCCNLATIGIAELPEREQKFFAGFMPQATTAIALLHHIVKEEEWTWYAIPGESERCDADDHLKELCEKIRGELIRLGYDTRIIRYPGQSGLQFRFVAQSAGLGIIGTNAFLFHPYWGPWVHLRILATTAEINIGAQMSGDQLCNHCGLCISECPAGAIAENSFSGKQCRSFRQARGEYQPHGPEGLLPYCKQCAWICPQGKPPMKYNE